MLHRDALHVLDLIRQLRAYPKGDEERAISEFLRDVKGHRLPSIYASALALAIAESGSLISTKQFARVTSVHSTGAPGSLSTFLAPILVAACGLHVPLVSVRGSVAGAIDSLASIPGYNDSLTIEDFLRVLEATKLAHIGHSEQIAPADLVLWKLREAVGAKEEPVLIAASLLGKKLAVGAMCGSIDVRVGPAGNVGKSFHEALETAWVIVSAAQTLGMRISCILTDATRLAWPRIGRLETVLSIDEIFSNAKLHEHPHVKLCREVAANACHAADPLTELDVWRKRVTESLRSGEAKGTFDASIAAHGAHPNDMEKVRHTAERRKQIRVQRENAPEPRSLSAFFKTVRSRITPEAGNALGVTWNEDDQTLAIHIPTDAGIDDMEVRRLAEAVQTLPAGTEAKSPRLIQFDGHICPCS